DEIIPHAGSYTLRDISIGQRQTDTSFVRIAVQAPTATALREILDTIHDHGAVPTTAQDCRVVDADMNGAFPEDFYSTTSFRTQIRLGGEWIEVEDQEMDCGILIDPEGGAARCIPMALVNKGDNIVVGRQGLRVFLDRGLPAEEGHEHHLRAINTIRRAGGIRAAIDKGILKSGIMYEVVKHNVPFVLAGSIRDDGPLPEVITDILDAQQQMREHVHGVGFCLMIATMLHSIATGNLLPAWVKGAARLLGGPDHGLGV